MDDQDTSVAEITAVMKALENEKYLWRTIEGIQKETQVDADKIRRILREDMNEVVRADQISINGQPLYTTREHFLRKASTAQKIMGAIKNRLA